MTTTRAVREAGAAARGGCGRRRAACPLTPLTAEEQRTIARLLKKLS